MPGVLILEAIAQASGILIYRKKIDKKPSYLVGVEKLRFRGAVSPGDTMILYSRFKRKIQNAYVFKGMAFTTNRVVCEAEIILI